MCRTVHVKAAHGTGGSAVGHLLLGNIPWSHVGFVGLTCGVEPGLGVITCTLVFQLSILPDNGSGTRVLLKIWEEEKRITHLKSIPSLFHLLIIVLIPDPCFQHIPPGGFCSTV